MEMLTTEALTALVTLTLMEIVLGIDNIIFIAILVGKLPKEKQEGTRKLGISLALIIRIALLFSISWLMSLKEPFMNIVGKDISGRDLILLFGGMFLVAKSTLEIHHKVEHKQEDEKSPSQSTLKKGAMLILLQILALDIVFSLDSVITAVGMANDVPIMIAAMIISMIVMLATAGKISDFVDRHPTIKILALSFLLLIGVMLIAEGMGAHVSKAYIYFAMFFSLSVEMLNMRYRFKSPDSLTK